MSENGELRCSSKLHGIIAGNEIEIVCKSEFCRKDEKTVVLHTFNIDTKQLIKTQRFQNPKKEK